MLGYYGLLLLVFCFIPVVLCSPRMSVTVEREYSYMRPNEMLALHMEQVLNRMTALKVTVHPRIRHLYDLLKKDIAYQGPRIYSQHHHFSPHLLMGSSPRPRYDVNKLNRIYTTEADVS